MHLPTLLQEIFIKHSLVYAVLSGVERTTIRPIKIKDRLFYQVTEQENTQAFHKNLTPEETHKYLLAQLTYPCKQAVLCTPEADYQILISKKGHLTILKKPPTKSHKHDLMHNRQKNYVLEEGVPNQFLIALGIMTREGKVLAKRRDKFKQLNRFIEIIADIIPHLSNHEKVVRIVDFGCGKAYLTFALYHYLVEHLGLNVEVFGLDLKKEVISECQQLALDLDYKGLKFEVGNIEDYNPQEEVNMVISLHACDTATDAAIEKGIRWDANVILSVPCCQHELFPQLRSPPLKVLLHHGILKERFSALVTDAARAQLLEILGYHTQVMEFIDLEHTPKNILIRAVKRGSEANIKQLLDDYQEFKKLLQIKPSLEQRFSDRLPKLSY